MEFIAIDRLWRCCSGSSTLAASKTSARRRERLALCPGQLSATTDLTMFRFLVGKTKGAARSVLHRAVRAQGDRVQLRVHQGLPQPVGSGELEGVLGEVQGLHRQRDSLYKLCGAGRSVPVACSAPAHTADTGSAFPSMRERSKITQYVLYVLRTGCLFVDLLRCRNCPITFH